MAVEVLIAATDLPPFLKGDIVVAKQSPAIWGGKEGLPDFIRLTISDRDLVDIEPYLDDFQNILQNDPPQVIDGRRHVRIFVDPGVVGKFDDAKVFKQEFRDYIVAEYSAVLESSAATEAVFSFPLEVSLADVRDDITDKFDERLLERRWHFSEASVDQVVGLGGTVTRTFAQVASVILDRKV